MGHSLEELNHFVSVGQCVYFVTLVMLQLFGNLFASRTRRLSVLQKNPFWGPSRNWRIPIAMMISIGIVLIVSVAAWQRSEQKKSNFVNHHGFHFFL